MNVGFVHGKMKTNRKSVDSARIHDHEADNPKDRIRQDTVNETRKLYHITFSK